jgi:hypothetical protein
LDQRKWRTLDEMKKQIRDTFAPVPLDFLRKCV